MNTYFNIYYYYYLLTNIKLLLLFIINIIFMLGSSMWFFLQKSPLIFDWNRTSYINVVQCVVIFVVYHHCEYPTLYAGIMAFELLEQIALSYHQLSHTINTFPTTRCAILFKLEQCGECVWCVQYRLNGGVVVWGVR